MSQFPAFIAWGVKEPIVREFDFLSTDAAQPGDLVYFDTADNKVKTAGADPASILGLSLGFGPASTLSQKPQPYAQNRGLVAVLTPDVVVGMSSTTTPSAANLGREYGIVRTVSGNFAFWQVDTADTTNTRVVVVGFDASAGLFYVRFKSANLQFDAI